MKNRLFRHGSSSFVGASVGLAVALLLLVLAARSSRAAQNPFQSDSHRQSSYEPSLVGAWLTSATLKVVPPGFPSPTFQAIDTFYSDGTMIAVAQIFGVTIGTGVWKQTDFNRYTFTFTFYRFDTQTTLMLPVQVNENVLMTGKDTYVTTDTILPMDINGKPLTDPQCGGPGNPPICAFPGTVQAQRYQFASFNNVLP